MCLLVPIIHTHIQYTHPFKTMLGSCRWRTRSLKDATFYLHVKGGTAATLCKIDFDENSFHSVLLCSSNDIKEM